MEASAVMKKIISTARVMLEAGEKGKAREMNTFAPDLNVDHIVPRIQFRKSRL